MVDILQVEKSNTPGSAPSTNPDKRWASEEAAERVRTLPGADAVDLAFGTTLKKISSPDKVIVPNAVMGKGVQVRVNRWYFTRRGVFDMPVDQAEADAKKAACNAVGVAYVGLTPGKRMDVEDMAKELQKQRRAMDTPAKPLEAAVKPAPVQARPQAGQAGKEKLKKQPGNKKRYQGAALALVLGLISLLGVPALADTIGIAGTMPGACTAQTITAAATGSTYALGTGSPVEGMWVSITDTANIYDCSVDAVSSSFTASYDYHLGGSGAYPASIFIPTGRFTRYLNYFHGKAAAGRGAFGTYHCK